MVLIKDMEMPTSCGECKIQDYYYGECRITHRKTGHYADDESVPKWCPLTEVQQYGPEGTLYKEK